MNSFVETQARLDELVMIPADLPRVYLLGDTGTGKTSLVRQILGTKKESFPSVRQKRTTIAVTEYVIVAEGPYTAAMLLKSPDELRRNVVEILEDTLYITYKANKDGRLDPDQVVENLEESPDERFKLKYLVPDNKREEYAREIVETFLPLLDSWIEQNFPDEDEIDQVFELALEEGLKSELATFQERILDFVAGRVRDVSGSALENGYILIEEKNRSEFIARLKTILAAESGSLSPVISHARVRGPMSADWLSETKLEIVLIDGEGIGHDTREDKALLSRHLDYFYVSDQIVLVEDAEKPFNGGGKGAISGIVNNGYLSRFALSFCRLDRVDADTRNSQVREVDRGLRNVLNALSEQCISIEKHKLERTYIGDLDKEIPDPSSIQEILSLLQSAQRKASATRERFVRPTYDYELVSAFLDRATQAFRELWDDYLFGRRSPKKPWQTVKAFNRRMVGREDGYKSLQPISELHAEIMKYLNTFFATPANWDVEVTERLRQSSIDRLRQEFAQLLKELIREALLAEKHGDWEASLELSGRGSTYTRANKIERIISDVAPPLTAPDAAWIKDRIKNIVNQAIEKCIEGAQEETT